MGAPTFPMLRDATQTALFEQLEVNDIPFEFLKAEQLLTMKETRSKIIFRAVDEFERLRGTNLAWFGIDELTYAPEGAWLRLEGRLRDPLAKRLCGFAVWTPKGYDWVYRRFIANPAPGYHVVQAKPFENRHLLLQTPDFYERLRHSYDEKFFAQEVLGAYLNSASDLVYHAFDRNVNLQEMKVDPRLPLRWALDFNVNPMCSVVAQIDGEKVRVLDEIVLANATTYGACEAFWERFRDHPGGVVIYADASGNQRHTSSAETNIDVMRRFFSGRSVQGLQFRVPRSNPTVRHRVELVNARLRSAAGETNLWAAPTCRELVKDFEQVTFEPHGFGIDKTLDPKRTHISDALGYLIAAEFSERRPAGYQGQRLF